MLNADMALIVNVARNTVDANTGQVNCVIGGGPGSCPLASTFGLVARFAGNNADWLNVFEDAFDIMIHKGCTRDAGCTTGLCTCLNG